MILNVMSVTALFLAAAGAVLALAVLWIAVRSWWRDEHCWATKQCHSSDTQFSDSEMIPNTAGATAGLSSSALGDTADSARPSSLHDFDDRAHLLGLVLSVLAVTRLIAWPQFYGLLESYVEPLRPRGVMCVYGVVQLNAALLTALQWLKPTVLWGMGLWFAMLAVDRRTRHGPLTKARRMLALPIALAALAESAGEAAFVLADKGGPRITCCTEFLKTATTLPPAQGLWEQFGIASPIAIAIAYLAVHAATIAGCLVLVRRGNLVSRRPSILLLAALGTLNLLVTYATWQQLVAPRVLGLPYHHCVYELLTGTLALGPAAALAMFGSTSLLWPAALQCWRRRAADGIAPVQQRIYARAAAALASELLIVAVHMA